MPMKRRFALAATATLMFGLAACGGGEDESNSESDTERTPGDVITAYVESLNNDDFEQALALVNDTADVTPEQIARFDDFMLPEPRAVDTEFDEDAEAVTLTYRLDGADISASFVKDNEQWKLEEPLFLAPMGIPEGNDIGTVANLANAGIFPEPIEGVTLFETDYLVMFGERDYPLVIEFPGDEYLESETFEGDLSFELENPTGELDLNLPSFSGPVGITDTLYQEFPSLAEEHLGESWQDHSTVSDMEMDGIDSCTAGIDEIAEDLDEGTEYTVSCSNASFTQTIHDDPDLADAGEVTEEDGWRVRFLIEGDSITVQ